MDDGVMYLNVVSEHQQEKIKKKYLQSPVKSIQTRQKTFL